MKTHKIALTILSCLLAAGLHARTLSANEIIKLRPGYTSAQELEAALGTAAHTDNSPTAQQLKYNFDNYTVIAIVDKKSGLLWKLDVMATRKHTHEMPALTLKNGTTNMSSAIDAMGEPDNILADSFTQRMKFDFSDNIVILKFDNGTLLDYEVSGFKKKS